MRNIILIFVLSIGLFSCKKECDNSINYKWHVDSWYVSYTNGSNGDISNKLASKEVDYSDKSLWRISNNELQVFSNNRWSFYATVLSHSCSTFKYSVPANSINTNLYPKTDVTLSR